MKKSIFLFLIAIISTQAITAQNTIDGNRIIKVLSFNILHGATTQGTFDLDTIAQLIIDANPDFVALQEVDFQTNRAKKYDLVTELGWRAKLAPIFARAMPYDDGEYGEGVLSKYSFLQTRNVGLPFSPGNEPRAALEILTILPSKDTIAFIGTHLDHTRDETDRVAQAKALNAVFTKNKYPTILAGDLNAEPGSTPMNVLESVWQAAYDPKNPENTYPSTQATKKIDYVLFYPRNRWRVLETKVIKDAVASDHCAYLVTLELLEK
ncbi:MAG: hypothetical protein Sapg2KO_51600 [Saprospiraceae bacterium]